MTGPVIGLHDRGDRISWNADGGEVFADLRREAGTWLVTHVEAAPALRGTGAADKFMHALVDHARSSGVQIRPLCSYAAAWLTRHPEHADLVNRGL